MTPPIHPPQFLFFTEVSPAYREIFDRHFSPSWNAEFAAHSLLLRRDCPDGDYGSPAYRQHMVERAHTRAEAAAMHQPDGEQHGIIAVFCDSDMRFYPGARATLRSLIRPGRVYCAADSPTIACGGFIAFIPSLATTKFFEAIPPLLTNGGFEHDQAAMNHERFPFRSMIEHLPHTFWTHGIAPEQTGVWDGVNTATLPPLPKGGIALHHANFTIGAANKLRLLDHYQKKHNHEAK